MNGPASVGTLATHRPEPSTPLARCRRVAHTYGTGITAVVAVHEVDCDVLPTTRAAITGTSGSGKSTLLHILAGLQAPTVGEVSWPRFNSHPLSRPGLVGMVFQGPSLLPSLDAMENVAFPLLLADVAQEAALDRSTSAMRRLRILDLAGRLPQELSDGQAQRVAVARVLACAPALILADEPTAQLDHRAAALVIDVLLETADELGAGLVISTHDPVIARRLPTRWAMLDGRLTAPGTTVGSAARPPRSAP